MSENGNGVLEFQNEQKNGSVSPRELLLKYVRYIPWIVLSLATVLILAFLKLRYSPRVYKVAGNILVKDPNPYGSSTDKFDNIFFMQPNRNLNDEIQIIRSRNIAKRVVKSLNLQTLYYNKGKILSGVISPKDSPFTLEIINNNDSSKGFSFQVHVMNDTQFRLTEKGQPFNFGQTFERSQGTFRINRTHIPFNSFVSPQFYVIWQPLENRSAELIANLKVSPSGEATNILALSYETENTHIGTDVINQFMTEYQSNGLEDKREISLRALEFIDTQKQAVRKELTVVEKNLQGYREKNKIFNPEKQSEIYFGELSELDKQITQQEVQIRVLDGLITYVGDVNNPYRMVPSVLGVQEPSLIIQITDYNKLQVERASTLKSTTVANPIIKGMDAALERIRTDILQNLRNVRQASQVAISDLKTRNNTANAQVSSIPGKEKQLLDITRQQKILEELYSYLLQKQLETSIGSASTISNVRVVEPAIASTVPFKPNPRGVYSLALFLGLVIPGVFIFLKEYLNDKIGSRTDVQKNTTAPIIGEVGHSDETTSLVVTRNNRKFIAEQFRIIRSNLQFILPKNEKPVILVTSSFSGEGKSFATINMAAVMALTGKKTVILEFDIRKPKILSNLELKKNSGITNYIIGKATFEELPIKVERVENLYVIPCGPVPPNPSELLLDERLKEFMQEVKKAFEVVIIDTAPVGLVSDAMTLGQYADATLYLVRHDYTYKKQMQLIEDFYQTKKLPRLSLILNDIQVRGGYYGNYHSYGGYGYGTAYGSEYFEKAGKKKKSMWQKITNGIFS